MAGGVTNLGLKAIVGLTADIDTQTAFDSTNCYMACGSGNTAFVGTQTTLVSEITTGGLARAKPDTITSETTTSTDDTLRFVLEFTITATLTVKEWAMLNASSAGVMLARDVPSSSTSVASGDTLTHTFDVILARA